LKTSLLAMKDMYSMLILVSNAALVQAFVRLMLRSLNKISNNRIRKTCLIFFIRQVFYNEKQDVPFFSGRTISR